MPSVRCNITLFIFFQKKNNTINQLLLYRTNRAVCLLNVYYDFYSRPFKTNYNLVCRSKNRMSYVFLLLHTVHSLYSRALRTFFFTQAIIGINFVVLIITNFWSFFPLILTTLFAVQIGCCNLSSQSSK